MSRRPGRTTAEWVALAVSSAILLVVFALVTVQLRNPDALPDPVARVERIRPMGDRFHVQVSVRNNGDQTAADVQVSAELATADGPATGDQTIAFLAGGGVEDLTFVFEDDPAAHNLTVTVTGFADP